MQLDATLALNYLGTLSGHEPDGECLMTDSFIALLKEKASLQSTHFAYTSIAGQCIGKSIVKPENRMIFLAKTSSSFYYLSTLEVYVDPLKIDWQIVFSSISQDQAKLLFQKTDVLKHIAASEQLASIMTFPCVLYAMSTITGISNQSLIACLNVMSIENQKRHVWKAQEFDFDFFMRYVKDLEGIDWNTAFQYLTDKSMCALAGHHDFFANLPEKDHITFLANCDLRLAVKEHIFNNINLAALSLSGLFLVAMCSKNTSVETHIIERLQALQSPCITAVIATLLPSSRYVLHLDDKGRPNNKLQFISALFPRYDDSTSMEKPEYNLRRYTGKKGSQIIFNKVNDHISRQGNRVSVSSNWVECVLFLEQRIIELNTHYENKPKQMLRSSTVASADMFGYAYQQEPKMVFLRRLFIYLLYYKQPSLVSPQTSNHFKAQFLDDLLKQLPKINPQNSLSSTDKMTSSDLNKKISSGSLVSESNPPAKNPNYVPETIAQPSKSIFRSLFHSSKKNGMSSSATASVIAEFEQPITKMSGDETQQPEASFGVQNHAAWPVVPAKAVSLVHASVFNAKASSEDRKNTSESAPEAKIILEF